MSCTVAGCDRIAKARGLCMRHYKRVWRHGSTDERDNRRTHCQRGHALTPDNLQIIHRASGRITRRCRACDLMRAAAYRREWRELIGRE